MEPTHYQKEIYEFAKSLDHDALVSCLVNAEIKAGDMANRNRKLEKNNRILASNLKKAVKEKNKLKQKNIDWLNACDGYVDNPDDLEDWMSCAIHEDDEWYSKYVDAGILKDELYRAGDKIRELEKHIEELEAEATLENDKLRAEIKSLKPVSKNTEKEWNVVYKSMCKEIEELKKQIK